jgi:hypothetical protein
MSDKGLMNRSTAAARKAAANKMLGILDESEAADISQIDLDEVVRRFHNLAGANYTPHSLNTYKSRLTSAVEDFLRYQKDPLNFKPTVQNGPRRPERTRTSDGVDTPRRVDAHPKGPIEAPPAAVNILPIPIRPDLTIKIQGLPFDLTVSEANKIANVIKAMANED